MQAMNPDDVKALLLAGLPDCEVAVDYDGHDFNIHVVGEIFQGLRKVQRQQKVLGVLHEQITGGAIHAVNVNASTPDEQG